MKTLGEVLNLAAQFLKGRAGRLAAEELLAHLLKVKRIDLYMQFDRPLDENELTPYRALLKRKAAGEPLEYILGEVSFFHCSLAITPAVLIPRQETEILADKITKAMQGEEEVWDLCTGSGCLGIALKKRFSAAKVSLSDISAEALEVARKNAQRNGVDVAFYQGDLLEPFKGKKADVIVCNPPYVSESEYGELDEEVLKEPKGALVSGPTGLECYERLARELPAFLNPKAKVFFEIGFNQGEKVKELFCGPFWSSVRIEKDWAGLDRFFFLET